jgi:cell division protein FtsA
MNPKPENLITVLDAGSQKSCVLVAEVADGVLRYRGHGIEPSRGMRKGLIAELGPAAEAINRAALTAERTAKATIETAVVGIGGMHVRGINSRGGISMGSRMREITREEIRAAVDRARSVPLPPDREVMHLLPQEFILDDQAGIHDPIGMVGNRLEVNLHLSTCSGGIAQSVITCANRAGLEVEDTVFEGIAAAEAVLSADERELGVCMADIGASTTEIAVYFEGSIAHTSVLPIGGDHFTNDLAVGLHVSVEEAEQLKREYGNCVVTSVPQLAEIEVGGNLTGIAGSGQPARLVRQRFLAEILEPRARELFTMLRDNLRQGGVLEALGAGCVLTGGGANLVGLLDNAESLLRVPARVGLPVPLSRMPQELVKPEYTAAIGMLLYTHRTQIRRAGEERGLKAKLRSIFAGSF